MADEHMLLREDVTLVAKITYPVAVIYVSQEALDRPLEMLPVGISRMPKDGYVKMAFDCFYAEDKTCVPLHNQMECNISVTKCDVLLGYSMGLQCWKVMAIGKFAEKLDLPQYPWGDLAGHFIRGKCILKALEDIPISD